MDIKKSGVWMTASESELLHQRSVVQKPLLALRIMDARDSYVAAHPVDPATVAEVLAGSVRAAILKSVGARQRARLLKAFITELSLGAAKDEAGIEQAVVGPINISATELIVLRRMARETGDDAQAKIGAYEQEMAVPASELDYLGRQEQKNVGSMLYSEVTDESLVASGIVHAVDAHFGGGHEDRP